MNFLAEAFGGVKAAPPTVRRAGLSLAAPANGGSAACARSSPHAAKWDGWGHRAFPDFRSKRACPLVLAERGLLHLRLCHR